MASQEDDATELQFPKDSSDLDVYHYESVFGDPVGCDCCLKKLTIPYVECDVCTVHSKIVGTRYLKLCLSCFSQGQEFNYHDGCHHINMHENNHAYVLVKLSCPLLEHDWTAKEELMLLNAISECGLGNWTDISLSLGEVKSANECKSHYFYSYIMHPIPELDIMPSRTEPINQKVPYPVPHIMGTENPVRPLPGSNLYNDTSGYNAARGDFIVEHLNDAESLVSDIDLHQYQDDDDAVLIESLHAALLDIYQVNLLERKNRKSIIKRHALINLTKATSTLNYHKSRFPEVSSIICKLYPLLTGDQLSRLVEGFNRESELHLEMQDLKEYRCNGLTKASQINIYEDMKMRHEINHKKKRKLIINIDGDDPISLDEVSKLNVLSNPVSSNLKRMSVPLNITGEPDYENLNNTEKALSSSLRVLPKDFNQMKMTMVNECQKLDGLHLRQARLLFKIDVNKTRKMYDLFVEEGIIYKPME